MLFILKHKPENLMPIYPSFLLTNHSQYTKSKILDFLCHFYSRPLCVSHADQIYSGPLQPIVHRKTQHIFKPIILLTCLTLLLAFHHYLDKILISSKGLKSQGYDHCLPLCSDLQLICSRFLLFKSH